MFYQYERSFTDTKMIGMISTKENFVFLISPRNDKVLKLYPEMEKGHLLGIYFIKTKEEIKQKGKNKKRITRTPFRMTIKTLFLPMK
jgi:hypothetical protein